MIRLVLEQATLEESGPILARSKLRAIMHRMGYADVRREWAELVCTEMLTNQHKYAGGGGLFQLWETLEPVAAIELFAIDYGPGIADPGGAHEDGYTTSGSMGRGLGAIKRLADESAVYSLTREAYPDAPWTGAAVWARFYRSGERPAWPFALGGFLRAYQDAGDNGDCICLACDSERLRWLHLDGLGHGAEAARVVTGMKRRLDAKIAPQGVMENVSAALRGERGAVGLAAEVDAGSGMLRLCGVGDLTAAVLDGHKRTLPFVSGVLGHAHRRFQTNESAVDGGETVITASDGIRKSWNEHSFPGLWRYHPQMIALLLGNVVSRNNDDRSVFAVRLDR